MSVYILLCQIILSNYTDDRYEAYFDFYQTLVHRELIGIHMTIDSGIDIVSTDIECGKFCAAGCHT